MKLLFDRDAPARLRRHLPEHSVDTLAEKGWFGKDNGELLDLAEREGYEALVTSGQNFRYQQSLASGGGRAMAAGEGCEFRSLGVRG